MATSFKVTFRMTSGQIFSDTTSDFATIEEAREKFGKALGPGQDIITLNTPHGTMILSCAHIVSIAIEAA